MLVPSSQEGRGLWAALRGLYCLHREHRDWGNHFLREWAGGGSLLISSRWEHVRFVICALPFLISGAWGWVRWGVAQAGSAAICTDGYAGPPPNLEP